MYAWRCCLVYFDIDHGGVTCGSSGFHINDSATSGFQFQCDSMSVFVHFVVIDSTAFVEFQFFFSEFQTASFRRYFSPDMHFFTDMSLDIVTRKYRDVCISLISQSVLVYSPAVLDNAVFLRLDSQMIVTVPFNVEVFRSVTEVESVYKVFIRSRIHGF